MSDRHRVLVVGDVMRDILVMPVGPMRRGSDVNASIQFVPGGSAANQAKWLAHQNADVALVARVGPGDGETLRAEFAQVGVEAILTEDPILPTGTLINLSEPEGERSFFTDRGANQNLAIEDVPQDTLVCADMVLLSGYLFFAEAGRHTALGLLDKVRSADTCIAIDAASAGFIADVGVSTFLKWTVGADILFANAQEAELLSGEQRADRQIAVLLEHYKHVVIKKGAEGAIAAGPDGDIHSATATAETCIDSTGAGDAFAAGFLAHKLGGAPLPDCLDAGNRTAALAVGRIGGSPPLA